MATRTISNAGGNWNSTSTWVEGIIPTASDDVVATSTSGPLSSNSVTNSCLSLDLTNYTFTLTITTALYVYGDITLGSSSAIGGTTYLYIRANSNITSNGVTIPYLRFLGSDVVTINLIDDLHVGTQFYLTSGTGAAITAITINNNNIYCYGGFFYEGFSRLFGTANLIMAGTGNLYGNNQFGEIYNPVIIDSPSGTITIIGEMNIATSLTYTSGTIVMGSGTYLTMRGTGTKTIDFSPVAIWTNINLYSVTASLLTDLYTNDLILDRPVLNSSSISVYRNLGSVGSQGTTEIVIAGSGSWSSNQSYYSLRNNLTIKTTGSFTITGSNDSTMNYYTGKITYISGTVIQPTTLNIFDSTTFDTSGMTWNKLNIRDGSMTLSSSLNATTMSLGYPAGVNVATNLIFTGSSGFNANVLSINNNPYPRNINLTPGTTYNVSDRLISSGSVTFRASSSIDRAYFNLALAGSQNVSYTNATNIDSSGGQTIFSLGGNLANSINWSNYPSNFFLLFE